MTESTTQLEPLATSANWHDYLELCKPKVVILMLLTAIVGMFLATPQMVPLKVLILGTLGIGFTASSAAVINHLVDRRVDAIMARTQRRPIAKGKIVPSQAIIFAAILGMVGITILLCWVNRLTAILTVCSLIGYAGIYTGYLKRATAQNIVIGGLAGAAPPLLGWTAVTGEFNPQSLLLVLLIFVWTPPHFWALAIYRYQDYLTANIPMLPVTHGIKFTKLNILLYTILLLTVSILPYAVNMSGIIYLIGAVLLGVRFLYWAIKLMNSEAPADALHTFRFSIVYLMLLFIVILVDHYLI